MDCNTLLLVAFYLFFSESGGVFIEPKDINNNLRLMKMTFILKAGDVSKLLIIVVVDKGNRQFEFEVLHYTETFEQFLLSRP